MTHKKHPQKKFPLKILAGALLIALVLAAFYILWFLPRYTVPILMYHRFGHQPGSTLFVTPENFERQMQYLKDRGYKVITLEDLVLGIKANKKFSHDTVVITVDDGYADFYTYAFPVLKKYNYPATVFLMSNYLDRDEDFLTRRQLKEMMPHGISFGGHTRSNAYLPGVKDDYTLKNEIAGCKTAIQEKLGARIILFCYPAGGFNEKIKQMVKDSGYIAACTTNRGKVAYNKDIYELKRVKVTDSDTNKPLSFWAKLSGYYNLFRRPKKSH